MKALLSRWRAISICAIGLLPHGGDEPAQLANPVQSDAMGNTEQINSKGTRTFAVVLIVVVGLLNFHIPHFLLESAPHSDFASRLLELALLANLVGAMTAALGVYRNMRWGWALGVYIACFSVLLYVLQETIGLPGLPQVWSEPSRIVSLIVEVLFLALAWRRESSCVSRTIVTTARSQAR